MDTGTINTIRRVLIAARAVTPVADRGIAQNPARPARNMVVDPVKWAAYTQAVIVEATARIRELGYTGITVAYEHPGAAAREGLGGGLGYINASDRETEFSVLI